MKIKALVTIMHDGEEFPAGSLIELENKDADRLIRLKSAIPYTPPELAEGTTEEGLAEGGDNLPGEEEESSADAIARIEKVEGVSVDLAKKLYESGFITLLDIAEADSEELKQIPGIVKKNINAIKKSALALAKLEDN